MPSAGEAIRNQSLSLVIDAGVINAVMRIILDLSFDRTGGIIGILDNENDIGKIKRFRSAKTARLCAKGG
jgi:hypothetical protein